MVAVCATAQRRELDDWLTVLAAAGIPARAIRIGAEWQVFVPDAMAPAARAHVREFRLENPGPRRRSSVIPGFGWTPAGLYVAVVLVALHGVSFLDPGRAFWIGHGRASAWRILDGEVWRAVTALTLHADAAHVAGNAAGMAVFGGAVAGVLGSGVGLLAILASGFLGNLMNAVYRGAAHATIGASTAVFGAVGILAGIQLVRRLDWGELGRRRWLPLGAAIAILAMIGVSPESDFLAHGFGMLSGLALGAGLAAVRLAPWGRPVQFAAGSLVPVAVGVAWVAALGL